MNPLLQVLRSGGPAMREALAEGLRQSTDPAVAACADGVEGIFEATVALAEHDDPAPARAWTQRLCRNRTERHSVCATALVALAALEQVVRAAVVERAGQKKALIELLDSWARVVEAFRAEVVSVCFAGASPAGHGSEQQARALAAVIENSRDVVVLASLQGKPFFVNRVGRRLLGLGEDDPISITSLRGYHDEASWAELRDVAVPAVKQTGRWEGVGRLRAAETGERIDVDTTMLIVPGENDAPGCLVVVHRSRGREAKLRRELEEIEARKHAILETSLDPIITINHEGVITEFNRAAEQVFGRKRKEVLGTQPSDILFPPSKIEGHQNRIDRYLNAGEGSLLSKRTEVVAVRASGLPFEAELTMTISREGGKPVLTFFVRDISARKQAEEEQRRYARELERSNRELEQFAYVASHDLQEPLRKICTFGDRLQASCGEALDEMGRTCLERMQNAAVRMQALIRGLLTLSRVTTAGADFVPVDLNKTAGEVVSDLEVKIEQNRAQIEVDRLPTLEADPLQMRQLLQNLIGNAIKFRRDGQTPRVRLAGRYVNADEQVLGGRSPIEECEITVEDNGIGFDTKYLDRIFGVFQRLHPREVYEGTGVGLAICRKIVERHGGEITARSRPDHGATFIVTLPVRHPNTS